MSNYYLAIDIGASSGRHIIGEKQGDKILLHEIYRFDNNLIEKNGHLMWDWEALFNNIIEGIKRCKQVWKIPSTIAIDTWGVDYALLAEDLSLASDIIAYRDNRTKGIDTELEKSLSYTDLYSVTGIGKNSFNSIYQLLALKRENPKALENAEHFLLMPEYFSFLLTGEVKNEYTNATTTALINAKSKTWDRDLIEKIGLNPKIFGEINMPGSLVGELKKEIQEIVGFNSKVIFAASHDTGSAFMAVPAKDEKAVYISSGTWSLLGMESDIPITDNTSRENGFTNEGGYGGKYRYLKNIMGLWIIQSIRRNLGKRYSFSELEAFAKKERGFMGRIDVNDIAFMAPKSMIDTVVEKSSVITENIGQIMECVYRSLADSYKNSIVGMEKATGKKFSSINIVGGGSKDAYLNKLTAEATGLPVYAGPTEGTALGNIMCQMIEAGEFSSLEEARKAVKNSFDIIKY